MRLLVTGATAELSEEQREKLRPRDRQCQREIVKAFNRSATAWRKVNRVEGLPNTYQQPKKAH